MPVSTTITSRKFLNQFINGVDFLSNPSDTIDNLAANCPELQQSEYEFEIFWEARASTGNAWDFTKVDNTNFIVERPFGSFFDDGFWVGAVCNIFGVRGTFDVNFNILSISDDGRILRGTNTSSNITLSTRVNVDDLVIRPDASDVTNALTSLYYGFNVLGQEEQYNKTSKVSGNPQSWYFRSLSGVASSGIAQGLYNDWVTGSIECTKLANPNDYTQKFNVKHTFRVVPFFLEGEQTNLEAKVAPNLFTGDNTLKYAFDVDFRVGINDPNKSVKTTFDNVLGSTGWFEENFDGLDNDYEIVSIVYEDVASTDAVDGLQVSSRTKATITVAKKTGPLLAGQRAGVYVSYLPTQSEYQNTNTTLEENFIFDSEFHNQNDPPQTGLPGVIKAIGSSIVSNNLVIEVEFEYDLAQQLRLVDQATGLPNASYLISVQIGDSALPAISNDRVNLIADVNQYRASALITGLATVTKFNYLVEGETLGIDAGNPAISEIWNEDNVLIDGEFKLDLASNKLAFLDAVQFSLVAFNSSSNRFFLLDQFNINTAASVVSGEVQQIEVEQSRGYTDLVDNQFNLVRINTGAKVGDEQFYSFAFGQKLRWQDWQRNNAVDSVFYDANEPQENLNFKSSNYSGLEGYEIKLIATFNTTGLNEVGIRALGQDIYFGGDISVNDYGVSSITYNTASITTKDVITGEDLDGRLSDADTLIESRFDTGTPVDPSQARIIHRYEKTNQSGNVLPEIEAQVTLDGSALVGRTVLGSELFDGDLEYNFSARLISTGAPLAFSFITDWDTGIDGVFEPILLGGTKTWIFGVDMVTADNPNYAGAYLDGTDRGVQVTSPDFSLITSIDTRIGGSKIKGALDLTPFTGLTIIDVRQNAITSLILDNTVPKTLTAFIIFGNSFTNAADIDLSAFQVIHNGTVSIGIQALNRFTSGSGTITSFNAVLASTPESCKEIDLSNAQIAGAVQINTSIGTNHRLDTLIFSNLANSGTTLTAFNTSLTNLDFSLCPFATYLVRGNLSATNFSLGTASHSLVEINALLITSLATFSIGGAVVDNGTTSINFSACGASAALVDSIYNQIDSAYDGISSLAGLTINTTFNSAPTAASLTARNNLSAAGATILT